MTDTNATLQSLEPLVADLRIGLGANLYSCALYGSTVRGNAIAGVSDINILILLEISDPVAHEAIASVLGSRRGIDPFILGRAGFMRSARAFAPKFASIRRNYKILHGPDPFAGLAGDPRMERFLCEQAVRNLRLRMVYAFVTRERHKSYGRFLARMVTPLFLRLAEILRLEGLDVPVGFEGRIAAFEKQFAVDGAALRDLLAYKAAPSTLSSEEASRWHKRIFPVVDAAAEWIEAHWKE